MARARAAARFLATSSETSGSWSDERDCVNRCRPVYVSRTLYLPSSLISISASSKSSSRSISSSAGPIVLGSTAVSLLSIASSAARITASENFHRVCWSIWPPTLNLLEHQLAVCLSAVQQELQTFRSSCLFSSSLVGLCLFDGIPFGAFSLLDLFLFVLFPVRSGLSRDDGGRSATRCEDIDRDATYVSGSLSCPGLRFLGGRIRALYPPLLLPDGDTAELAGIFNLSRQRGVDVLVDL